MSGDVRTRLREYIGGRLQTRGDHGEFTDHDSLFVSGRMDSLSAMEFLVFLERDFEIDFAEVGFDLNMIDSIDAVVELLD